MAAALAAAFGDARCGLRFVGGRRGFPSGAAAPACLMRPVTLRPLRSSSDDVGGVPRAPRERVTRSRPAIDALSGRPRLDVAADSCGSCDPLRLRWRLYSCCCAASSVPCDPECEPPDAQAASELWVGVEGAG